MKPFLVVVLAVLLAGCTLFPRTHPDPKFSTEAWQFSVAGVAPLRNSCPSGGFSLRDVHSFDDLSFEYADHETCVTFEGSRQLRHEQPTTYQVRFDGNFSLVRVREQGVRILAELREPSTVEIHFEAGRANLFLTGTKTDHLESTFALSMEWAQVDP